MFWWTLALLAPASAADLGVGAGQAYATVADAVAAAVAGDRLLVHEGTYNDSVEVDRSITVVGVGDPDAVVLRGTGGDAGFFDVVGSAVLQVQGLTLATSGNHRSLRVQGSAQVVLDGVSVLDGRSVQGDGGCVWVGDDASLWVRDSWVEGCAAGGDGGALLARDRGSVTVERSVLAGHVADGSGAAIACVGSASCTVVEGLLVDNVAGAAGGGLYAEQGGEVVDSVLCHNTAAQGGALHLASAGRVINDHLVANVASDAAAALWADGGEVVNVLVLGSDGPDEAVGGAGVQVRYSWLHDNVGGDLDGVPGPGVTLGGDPQLVDYRVGDCVGSDFQLAASSPLRDGGDPDPAYVDPDGSVADIGAFEPAWADVEPPTTTEPDPTEPDPTEPDPTEPDPTEPTPTSPTDPTEPDPAQLDSDGDGWVDADDCAPLDPAVHPGAVEVPDDGVDQDCTGHDLLVTYGSGAGCGCAAVGSASGWWVLLSLAVGSLRRRTEGRWSA
jgi:hypothetical protein